MRVLVLLPEAFGGRGGIAAYNRDLLTAMASVPRIEEIVVLPRSIRGEVESLPSKIVYKS